ncbi:MAG: phage head-tail adapter protein [Bacilli bacterium]|nr:phage head-tail adapter protein [Bacilli bacterium]
MNKLWSEKNKEVQILISKETTFNDGIKALISLRNILFEQITQVISELSDDDFSKMPFKNAKGYHNKTIGYSIWHIFRIEDVVAHEMIEENSQILFSNDYIKRINTPIITTGNELKGDEISNFSKKLNLKELYNYAKEVMESTNDIIRKLEYKDLKKKYAEYYKEKLINSKCVDSNEEWLVDYWCSKNIKGLIQMPFSRHWIMHIEAINRIKSKL